MTPAATTHVSIGVVCAFGAALLFGAGAPLAQAVLHATGANAGAALLYAGSGIGLVALLAVKRATGRTIAPIAAHARLRFAAAVLCGGVVAPALLVWGLRSTSGTTASLLLNLEGVLTATLAWLVFRENVGRRVLFGMGCMVAGGVVLSVPLHGDTAWSTGALAIAAACACWGIDNNLTQAASGADALLTASIKGVCGAGINTVLALGMRQAWPATTSTTLAVMALGFWGYGVSLVLFMVALRHLGTARTGAYFGIAPFVGALVAVLVFHEAVDVRLLAACALMALGVWLHLSERHAHVHVHEALTHSHAHSYDAHHQHDHDDGVDDGVPHTHLHAHAPLTHAHAHAPDLHHRHTH